MLEKTAVPLPKNCPNPSLTLIVYEYITEANEAHKTAAAIFHRFCHSPSPCCRYRSYNNSAFSPAVLIPRWLAYIKYN